MPVVTGAGPPHLRVGEPHHDDEQHQSQEEGHNPSPSVWRGQPPSLAREEVPVHPLVARLLSAIRLLRGVVSQPALRPALPRSVIWSTRRGTKWGVLPRRGGLGGSRGFRSG